MKTMINGVDVFVGQGGVDWQPGQRTLVLQHGAGMDRTVWVLLARYFARHGFNVVCADLPAHGASQGKALTTIEAQAEFLWRLLDQLQAEHGLPDADVVLGGHSMGALIAVEAAGQAASRVSQLILFGSGYPMPVAQPLLDAAAAHEQSAIDMIVLYSHCLQSQLGHNPVAGISIQNTAKALLERAAPGVLYADLAACNAYKGLEKSSLAFGPGKSTLIVGDADRMTPMKMSRQLIERLDGTLEVVSGCGHMMMSEQPEQTLRAVKRAIL